jgi:hypothetical protein
LMSRSVAIFYLRAKALGHSRPCEAAGVRPVFSATCSLPKSRHTARLDI